MAFCVTFLFVFDVWCLLFLMCQDRGFLSLDFWSHYSHPAYEDCGVSDWGAWDLCSVSCGTGTTSRKRNITQNVELWQKWCPKSYSKSTEYIRNHQKSSEYRMQADCPLVSATCAALMQLWTWHEHIRIAELQGKWGCSMSWSHRDTCLQPWQCLCFAKIIDAVLVSRVLVMPVMRLRSQRFLVKESLTYVTCVTHCCLLRKPRKPSHELFFCAGPIDCVWSDWADWQSCAASCGETTKKRVRTMKAKKVGPNLRILCFEVCFSMICCNLILMDIPLWSSLSFANDGLCNTG